MAKFITPRFIALGAIGLTAALAIVVFSGGSVGQPEMSREVGGPSFVVNPTPQPSVSPIEESPVVEELYDNCVAVWEALGRPITEADEGYPGTKPNRFDLDADGIGCEDNPSTVEDESEIDWANIWHQTKGNARDFGYWAGDKLKEFWSNPGIANTWEQMKKLWKDTLP